MRAIAAGLALILVLTGRAAAWDVGRPEPRTGSSGRALIAMAERLDMACRGRSGDASITQAACRKREEVYRRLRVAGWCLGENATVAARAGWARCVKPPSFPCTTVATRDEAMICSDPGLSSADSSFAVLLREVVPQDPAMRAKASQWLRERKACSDKSCLWAWYLRHNQDLAGADGYGPSD